MTITNGYTTLESIKTYLKLSTVGKESQIDDAINAASRRIDQYCQRFFYVTSSGARQFYAHSTDWVLIDDAATITAVTLDTGDDGSFATSLTVTTDYTAFPINAVDQSGQTVPYTKLYMTGTTPIPISTYNRPTVKVTGTWGWSSTPEPVRQACNILASELLKLGEAPFGVAGFDQYGAVRVKDMPQVAALLNPYVRGRSIPVGG